MTLAHIAQLALIGWLPGAALFRVPWFAPERRASLAPEERLFWHVVVSLVCALSAVLALASVSRYRFEYLLIFQGALTVAAFVAGGARRLPGSAPRPGLTAIIPLVLLALCAYRFSPPAEYIIGGKDPGVYVNEGVQIAQRGSLVVTDPLVASIPPEIRELFLPPSGIEEYDSLRFMGFFVQDADRGRVVGQFPHLFPAALAIGYGVDGLTGVRYTTPALAILGVLAVYFAGVAFFGRAAAAAGALLLALNVVEAWFGRYPNTEVMMQLLLFAAMLAATRWQVEGDRFFAVVAGGLLGLLLFLRFDAVLAIAAVVGAVVLTAATGRRAGWLFFVSLAVPLSLALAYLAGPMRGYAAYPFAFIANMPVWQHVALAGLGAAVLTASLVASRRAAARDVVTRWVPTLLVFIVTLAGMYALFLRVPGGKLAAHDALAMKTYAAFYVTMPAALAAIIGYALFGRAAFWRSPVFYVVVGVFGLFFFYKIRIVPEHFWAARRFVPVILPGTLLLAAAAAVGGRGVGPLPVRVLRWTIGIVFLVLLAQQYERASRPVLAHVEYAGVIPRVEQLAAQVTDRDLVVVEARDAGGDTHVVALPLAYIYARNVLMLQSARPDGAMFTQFLQWARTRYDRVLFLGGGGTDLASGSYSAQRVWSDSYAVPEYESVVNAYPRTALDRKFDYTIYALHEVAPQQRTGTFDLDVGSDDDLHVVRFRAKELTDGYTFRWTGARSIVSVDRIPPSIREVVLTMSDGGRPPAAPPAMVEVWLQERHLATFEVDGPFRPYPIAVPPDTAAAAQAAGAPLQLRLHSVLWNPRRVLGAADDRELGVMLDRVTVR